MYADASHRKESDLSIIVPARNEAATIVPLLARMRISFPNAEIIVVDNGSSDATARLAAGIEDVRVVSEPIPGKGNAMRCGARTAQGSVLLFHDADAEYCIEDARNVAFTVLYADQRDRLMVIGVRAWRLHWLPFISFGVNNLIRLIFWWRFGSAPEDVLTGTRCLSRATFLAMDTQSPTFSIETEMTRLALASNMKIEALPVRYTPRRHTEGKKINWRHLPPILFEALSRRMPTAFARDVGKITGRQNALSGGNR